MHKREVSALTGRLLSLDGLNQISKWPFYKHRAHALIARCRVCFCCYGNRCRLRVRRAMAQLLLPRCLSTPCHANLHSHLAHYRFYPAILNILMNVNSCEHTDSKSTVRQNKTTRWVEMTRCVFSSRRRASSECTGPLWIIMNSPWRPPRNAVRRTRSSRKSQR